MSRLREMWVLVLSILSCVIVPIFAEGDRVYFEGDVVLLLFMSLLMEIVMSSVLTETILLLLSLDII